MGNEIAHGWPVSLSFKVDFPVNVFRDTICTPPEFELSSDCRGCPEGPEKWRCNNGLCIDAKLVKNGVQDCLDGSDENSCKIKKRNHKY